MVNGNGNCRGGLQSGQSMYRRLQMPTELSFDSSDTSAYSDNSDSSVYSVTPSSVNLAVKATIPNSDRTAWRSIWKYARRLKAIPELTNMTADEIAIYAENWVLSLHPGSELLLEEVEDELMKAWEKVEYAEGDGPTERAVAIALKATPPPCATQFQGTKIRQMVSICRELQREAGDDPFYLSCRTVARLLGGSHVKAAQRLRILVRKGILKISEVGGPKTNRATRYRYTGDQR